MGFKIICIRPVPNFKSGLIKTDKYAFISRYKKGAGGHQLIQEYHSSVRGCGPGVEKKYFNSVVIILRADDSIPEGFFAPLPQGGHFRIPKPGEFDMVEFLDYIDDMSLLLGCPNCHSFNVREGTSCGRRIQICNDCDHWIELPRVN